MMQYIGVLVFTVAIVLLLLVSHKCMVEDYKERIHDLEAEIKLLKLREESRNVKS